MIVNSSKHRSAAGPTSDGKYINNIGTAAKSVSGHMVRILCEMMLQISTAAITERMPAASARNER